MREEDTQSTEVVPEMEIVETAPEQNKANNVDRYFSREKGKNKSKRGILKWKEAVKTEKIKAHSIRNQPAGRVLLSTRGSV